MAQGTASITETLLVHRSINAQSTRGVDATHRSSWCGRVDLVIITPQRDFFSKGGSEACHKLRDERARSGHRLWKWHVAAAIIAVIIV